MDVNALIDRLDLDQIVAKVDMNALLEKIDVDALVERTEIGSIIARSGAGVAGKVLDVAAEPRSRPRFLRAPLDGPTPAAAPVAAPGRSAAACRFRKAVGDMTAHPAHVAPERDVGLQGCYAGFVTRLAAFAIDVITALTLFAVELGGVEYVVSAVAGRQVHLSDAPDRGRDPARGMVDLLLRVPT